MSALQITTHDHRPLRQADEDIARSDRPPHLLLVASTGGHLAQLLMLRAWWSQFDRTWVTFDKADARSTLGGERIVFAHHPTTRNLPNAVRNLALARHTVTETHPSLVVSTGAGVAAPFFYVARTLAIPTLYIEVFDRIASVTLTGRMCRLVATAFCVQWKDQLSLYPGSDYIGELL